MVALPSPASTHDGFGDYHFDVNSLFVCVATRPSTAYEVDVSEPTLFRNDHIRYRCFGQRHNPNLYCVWTAIWWLPSPPGPITGPHYTDTQGCVTWT